MIASTATGIDAETVIPTLRNRYSDDAPKTIPSSEPRTTGRPGQLGQLGLVRDVRLEPGVFAGSRAVSSSPGIVAVDMSWGAPTSMLACVRVGPRVGRIAAQV